MLVPILLATIIAAPTPEVQYKQPQVAADRRNTVVAFGSGNAIYVAASADQGRSFRAPVKVAEPGMLSLGRHRGPRVTLTSDAIVVSAIAGEKGRGADGDVLAWRSLDGGATWSAGVRVNDVAGSAREGLHAMAARRQTVFAAWLDLRSQGTKVYGSVSQDGGATWSKNVLVYQSPDGSVCECCHPSVGIDALGAIHVMFRNSLAGSRDLYLAQSTDGGKSFASATKLGSATWKLNACPMDGGGMAVGSHGGVVSVWRRDKAVFTASDDRIETRIAMGKDPAVAGGHFAWTGDGGVWVAGPGEAPRLVGAGGAYVHLADIPGGGVVAVWEKDAAVVVERIVALRAPQRD
jgi:hypothetical protein